MEWPDTAPNILLVFCDSYTDLRSVHEFFGDNDNKPMNIITLIMVIIILIPFYSHVQRGFTI